jgi:hypothetical protein
MTLLHLRFSKDIKMLIRSCRPGTAIARRGKTTSYPKEEAMKQLIVGLSLALVIALAAGSVFARGFGSGDCPYDGPRRGQGVELSENQLQFLNESLKLRQGLAADQIELRTLLSREDRDEARVLQLRDSIAAQREQLTDLARQHDVELGPGKSGKRGGKERMRMRQAPPAPAES